MNIIKVVFIPKRNAPVGYKNKEYFVSANNWDEAINTASIKFKAGNALYKYYRDAIATTVEIL